MFYAYSARICQIKTFSFLGVFASCKYLKFCDKGFGVKLGRNAK